MWWTKKKEKVKFSTEELTTIEELLWNHARSIETQSSEGLTVEQVYSNIEQAKFAYNLRHKIFMLRHYELTK